MIEWIAQWILARRTPEKVMYIGGSDILPPPLEKGREQTAIEGLSRGDTISGWWCIFRAGMKAPGSTWRI